MDNLYTPEERRIYGPYPTGNVVPREDGFPEPEQLFADPIAAYRELNAALGGRPQQVIDDSNSDNPEVQFRAFRALEEAAARVFGLRLFDRHTGQGLFQDDCVARITDFLNWLKKKEPTGPVPPTAPVPLALESSRPLWDQGDLPTRVGSASGSTRDDCGCSDATT